VQSGKQFTQLLQMHTVNSIAATIEYMFSKFRFAYDQFEALIK